MKKTNLFLYISLISCIFAININSSELTLPIKITNNSSQAATITAITMNYSSSRSITVSTNSNPPTMQPINIPSKATYSLTLKLQAPNQKGGFEPSISALKVNKQKVAIPNWSEPTADFPSIAINHNSKGWYFDTKQKKSKTTPKSLAQTTTASAATVIPTIPTEQSYKIAESARATLKKNKKNISAKT